MAFINGINDGQYGLHVNPRGQAEAHSETLTELAAAAKRGDAYNFNTSIVTLTDAAETPVWYIKNNTSTDLIIPRIFLTAGTSTGGSGIIHSKLYYTPVGGDIETLGTAKPPANFKVGSANTVDVDAFIGATGLTIPTNASPIELLYPSDGFRDVTTFETIVMPKGQSITYTVTPPVGNTSMQIMAGYNVYQEL